MDPYFFILQQFAHATMRGYSNEFSFDQKEEGSTGHADYDDPVKFRFGAWKPADGRAGYYLGAISGDVLESRGDQPVRREKLFIAFKIDPEPCFEFFAQRSANTTEDRDMISVLRVSATEIEAKVPVKGFGGGGSSNPNLIRHGQWAWAFQSDGNFVCYDTTTESWDAKWVIGPDGVLNVV